MKNEKNPGINWTMEEYRIIWISLLLADQYYDEDKVLADRLIKEIESSFPEMFVSEEELYEMDKKQGLI